MPSPQTPPEGEFPRVVPQERAFLPYREVSEFLENSVQGFLDEQAFLRKLIEEHHEVLCEKFDRLASNHTHLNGNGGGGGQQATHYASEQAVKCQMDSAPAEEQKMNSNMNKPAVKKNNAREIANKAKALKKEVSRQSKESAVTEEDTSELHWLVLHTRMIVMSPLFDVMMCIVISANMFLMAVHLQLEGYNAAHGLGLRNSHAEWPTLRIWFEVVEKMFNIVYLVEMVVRIWAFRLYFFHKAFNVIDMLIVFITCLETFFLEPAQQSDTGLNLSALKVMRIFRIFRIHKVLRFTDHMGEMRMIIETLLLSMRGLFWSMLLISAVVMSGAILIVQLSLSSMDNESIDIERRRWLSNMFGSTSQAFYTMFECTFTSGWGVYARPMIEEVNPAFTLFWIPYVVCANFAAMKIVAALFLKQIMAVAALESKKKEEEADKAKEAYAVELRGIFAEADGDGSGAISKQEFETMLSNGPVLMRIEKMGLEIEEAVALFGMLSLDDGEADYEEFLESAIKMKANARAIDVVQVLHQQHVMHQAIEFLGDSFRQSLQELKMATSTPSAAGKFKRNATGPVKMADKFRSSPPCGSLTEEQPE